MQLWSATVVYSPMFVGTFLHLPICMHISPIAQVALLHTEMNSGFRLVPKIGMNSAKEKICLLSIDYQQHNKERSECN